MEKLNLVQPETRKSEFLGATAGVRPYRKGGIRLEKEKIGSKTIYHNYGHGGAGVSLAYGSAKYIVGQFFNDYSTRVKKVAIIGSGYMGLMQSILLADEGYDVTVYADNFPIPVGIYKDKAIITSQVAGGFWMPYGYDIVNKPLHNLLARDTFNYYKQCILEKKYAGLEFKLCVMMSDAPNLVKSYVPEGLINDFREVMVSFGNGVYTAARAFTSMLMDGDVFLNELMKEAREKKVKFVERKLQSVECVMKLEEEVVFNCSSMGSIKLFGEKNFVPIKGQLIYFKKPVGFNYFLQGLTPDGVRVTTYPQGNKQAIGLSYEENEDSTAPTAKMIETLRVNMEKFVAERLGKAKL